MIGRSKPHGGLTDREAFFLHFAKMNAIHLILRDESGATLSMTPLSGGRERINSDQLTVDLQENAVYFRADSNSGTTKFLAALEELKVPYNIPAEPPSLEYMQPTVRTVRAYEMDVGSAHDDRRVFRAMTEGKNEPEISITLDDAVKHLEAVREKTSARSHATNTGQSGSQKGKPASR